MFTACSEEPVDLVFVVDGSGSICDTDPKFVYGRDSTCSNWGFIVSFLRNFITSITTTGLSYPDLRVAMVQFASNSELRWDLGRLEF